MAYPLRPLYVLAVSGALTALIPPPPSYAFIESLAGGAGTAIGAGLAAKVGSDLIAELAKTGQDLIASGTNQGNALLVRAGNEMQVLGDNLTRLMGAEARKTVRQMGAEYQPMMAKVQAILDNAPSIAGRAYELKAAAVLDIRNLMRTLPGIGENFFVERIDGIGHLRKQEGSYRVAIWGTGLGQGTSTLRSTVRLSIGGAVLDLTPLPGTQINGATEQASDVATFMVPAEILAPLFREREIVVVPAAFHIQQETRSGWFGGWESSGSYEVPFRISLLPRYAGSVSIESKVPIYSWVNVRSDGEDLVSGNHHCDKHCPKEGPPYTLQRVVVSQKTNPPSPGDQRIVNAKAWCHTNIVQAKLGPLARLISVDTSGCPWAPLKSLKINDAGSRVTAIFTVNSKPVTLSLAFDIEEYKAGGMRIDRTKYDLYYGDMVSFAKPAGPGIISIGNGVTSTYTPFNFVLSKNDDQNVLSLQHSEVGDDVTTFIYRVNRPAGLD